MTVKAILKKLKITETSKKEIAKTLEKVEKDTSGEIAVAVTPESGNYSFYELLFSLVVGAVVFAFLLGFSNPIIGFLKTQFWVFPDWLFAAFCGIVSFITIGLVYLLVNIPCIDRKIIPQSIKILTTEARAQRCFYNAGIHKTIENSGILIYISCMERRVRILADSGIAKKIDQKEWDDLAQKLANNIKTDFTKAVCETLEECGKILKDNFPPSEENPDELPNDLMILEGGQW